MKMLRLTLILAAAVPLFAQADVTLRKAIRKETVEGDLKGAIDLYRRVAAEAGKDRATAAQALLHLAQCYEKQGNLEARRIYERLVREYPDQREAAMSARTRLGESTKPASGGVMQRFVRAERNMGDFSPSPDGRYLVFASSNLLLHDLATGFVRDIPRTSGGGFSQYPRFTPDSKRIVYTSRDRNATELRIIALDGTGMRTILRTTDYRYFFAHSISPDGGTVVTLLGLIDQTWQIALVSLDSGKVRVLKTVGWE
ncbi:MAG: PD40 domain-containing protein, partial [Bryobacterales bacterium]|nr:PD40 domain-containing protein [Bryobacterales bacterium]